MIPDYQNGNEKSAVAILYPDKIIVGTRIKKGLSTWYETDDITILPCNISNEELGSTIISHIERSKGELFSIEDFKKRRENYRKKAKFKSEKATMKNARQVSIYLTNDTMRLEPKSNRISKGAFYGMPDQVFEIKVNHDFAGVGSNIRKAWEACTFE